MRDSARCAYAGVPPFKIIMKSINFQTCQMTEYMVNGDPSKVVRINLLDVNLRKRIENAEARMEQIEEKYKGTRMTPEMAIAADAEIRAFIDEVFGTDVSTPAFGGTNCLLKIGELPLYAHFFTAFVQMIIEDLKEIAAQHKAAVNPNVEKYALPVITRQEPLAPLANPYGSKLDVGSLSEDQKAALLRQLLT